MNSRIAESASSFVCNWIKQGRKEGFKIVASALLGGPTTAIKADSRMLLYACNARIYEFGQRQNEATGCIP